MGIFVGAKVPPSRMLALFVLPPVTSGKIARMTVGCCNAAQQVLYGGAIDNDARRK
jgi:hypothetical protein